MSTMTSMEQVTCERNCSLYLQFNDEKLQRFQQDHVVNDELEIKLLRDKHIAYLYSGLSTLSEGYVSLDARYESIYPAPSFKSLFCSRPWIIYWVVHALTLLGEQLSSLDKDRVITALDAMQNILSSSKFTQHTESSPIPRRLLSGGFGGSSYQLSHWYSP